MNVLAVITVLVGAATCLPVDLTTKRPLTPDHVPSSVCESMAPVHGNNLPSQEPAPYTITATPSVVRTDNGDTVKVEFKGDEFRGLYVQARDVKTDKPVGRFLPLEEDSRVGISDCHGGEDNAATYIGGPIRSFTLLWEPPKESTTIVFKTTFVKTFAEFWVKVPSNEVVVQGS